jgi:hypothetical protein
MKKKELIELYNSALQENAENKISDKSKIDPQRLQVTRIIRKM